MFIKSRILLASAASILLFGACNAEAAEQAKNVIAATVNGVPITANRVDLIAQQRAAQGQPDTPEMRKGIIESLALQIMISDEAVKKGLDKTPEATDQLELLRLSALSNIFIEDYLKNNPVSDDALKAEYEKIKAMETGNEYKARHILVEKEADAKAIIAQLKKNPKLFEKLAKDKSKDPGSKANGGDLGWFDPSGMVPEFGSAVMALEKGKFTQEPIKSQYGYHVIMLEDSRAKQFPPMEQVKDKLSQRLQQMSLQKLFAEMKAKAKIEIVPAPVAAVPAAPAAPAAPVAPAPAPAADKK